MKQTQQIFDHFGIEAQKMKLIEEMAELTAELAKPRNERLFKIDEIHKACDYINKILDEIADVSIVLDQIIDFYGRDIINDIRQGKIERTLELIKSGYYKEGK